LQMSAMALSGSSVTRSPASGLLLFRPLSSTASYKTFVAE
jgi:hypothetical protein